MRKYVNRYPRSDAGYMSGRCFKLSRNIQWEIAIADEQSDCRGCSKLIQFAYLMQ